jgi:LemA protein
MTGFLIVLAILVAIAVWLVSIYNGLVRRRNECRNFFSQIDVQLQRRHDLIPNLVESAKAYMGHERSTLEAVVSARNAAVTATRAAAAKPGDPAAMQALAGAEGSLGASLGRLFAVAEGYPELKADQTIVKLMEELSSTENRVSFARQAFNDGVMEYATARESFPGLILAGGFAPIAPLPEVKPAVKEAPKVSFQP